MASRFSLLSSFLMKLFFSSMRRSNSGLRLKSPHTWLMSGRCAVRKLPYGQVFGQEASLDLFLFGNSERRVLSSNARKKGLSELRNLLRKFYENLRKPTNFFKKIKKSFNEGALLRGSKMGLSFNGCRTFSAKKFQDISG